MCLAILLISNEALSKDGSSGCGPGWYVAKKQSILSSAFRATTNGILGPTVTLGMTFGTSNCSRHSIVRNEVEDLKFATENYYEIAADSSKGSGPFLHAYSELMGCHGIHANNFKKQMKSNFQKIFQKGVVDPKSLVKESYIIIFKDQGLIENCFAA